MVQLRTKVEAIFIIALMVLISLSSVYGTRIITSTTDTTTGVVMYGGTFDYKNYSNVTLYTKIINSRGQVYNASAWNLQHAIWALNTTNGGTVLVPTGTFPFSSDLRTIPNLCLIGQGPKTNITGRRLVVYGNNTISQLTLFGSNAEGVNITGGNITLNEVQIIKYTTTPVTQNTHSKNIIYTNVLGYQSLFPTTFVASPAPGYAYYNATTNAYGIYTGTSYRWFKAPTSSTGVNLSNWQFSLDISWIHTNALYNNMFSANGFISRTGAGVYTIVTDGSTNWNKAYNSVNTWQAQWNTSVPYGNFAPNVTFITNSKGNKFLPTDLGIKSAIWDFNGTHGGTVWVPPGFYSFSTNLTIINNVTLIGICSSDNRYHYAIGTVINLTGTASVHILDGKLWNIQINTVAGWIANYAVYIDGYSYLWQTNYILDNVGIHNTLGTYTGTGLGIIAITTATRMECIAKCSFGVISIYGFNLGVEIHSKDGGAGNGYVNGNSFERIDTAWCTYGMNITDSDGGQSEYNTILAYDQQPYAGTKGGLFIGSTGIEAVGNNFQWCMFWDWTVSSYGDTVTVNSNRNHFSGYFAFKINDTGIGNLFELIPAESHVYVVYPTGYRDGTYINNTINSPSATYDKIIFMPGVYDIDTRIGPTNYHFEYEFARGAIFQINVTTWKGGEYMFKLEDGATMTGPGTLNGSKKVMYGIRFIGSDNVTVRDMTLKGFTSSAIFGSGYNILIDNCLIDNSSAYGIRTYTGSTNWTISNCRISECGRDISIYGSKDCKIINNVLDGNNSAAYGVEVLASSKRTIIQGNTFNNALYGVSLGASDNNTVIGNMFTNINSIGIYTIATTYDSSILSNNVFGCTTPVTDGGVRTMIRDNLGYPTFFDIINRTSSQPGYTWFNSASNLLMIKRSGGNWISLRPNNTYGNFAPNITYITNSKGNKFAVTAVGLQSALDLKGKITLPECNISITTSLTMYGGTILQGQGNKTILYLAAGSNDHNILNITGENSLVENIKFDINNVSNTGDYVCGIWLKPYTKSITIRGCYFTNIEWYGINQESSGVVSNADNMTVEGCFFYKHKYPGFGGAIAVRGSNNIIRNNRIRDMGPHGIVVEGGVFTTKNLVDGNVIIGPVSIGIYSEAIGNSQRTIITNNILQYINGTQHTGSPDGIAILAADNCTISNNYISYAARGGIKVEGNHSIVSNNIMNEVGYGYTGGYGIRTGSDFYSCNYNTISNNQITNNFVGGAADKPAYGIRLGGIHTDVSHNTISSPGPGTFDQGISTTDVSNYTISDNTIMDATFGIFLTGSHSNIHDNTFIDCGIGNYPAIYLIGVTYCNVHDNDLIIADRGIQIKNSFNNSIHNNNIDANDATYGIYEDTTGNYNTIESNNLRLSTTPSTSIKILGSSTIVRDNPGYLTESSGTATMAVGLKSFNITHNLSSLPNRVFIQARGNTSCANGYEGYNVSYTSTVIRIYVKGKIVNACTFFWSCSNITGGPYHNG